MKKKTNLLKILVICLLVFVIAFSITKIVMSILSTRLSTEEIQGFNSKITAYEGENDGEKVKELLNIVIQSNKNKDNIDKQIAIETDEIVDMQGNKLMLGEINGKKTELKNSNILQKNKMYNIEFKYGSNKLVKTVKISL